MSEGIEGFEGNEVLSPEAVFDLIEKQTGAMLPHVITTVLGILRRWEKTIVACERISAFNRGADQRIDMVAASEPMRADMTLRDWFAGMALEGAVACPESDVSNSFRTAVWCYGMADAMLKAREVKG